jgi:hypothetical protein
MYINLITKYTYSRKHVKLIIFQLLINKLRGWCLESRRKDKNVILKEIRF